MNKIFSYFQSSRNISILIKFKKHSNLFTLLRMFSIKRYLDIHFTENKNYFIKFQINNRILIVIFRDNENNPFKYLNISVGTNLLSCRYLSLGYILRRSLLLLGKFSCFSQKPTLNCFTVTAIKSSMLRRKKIVI